MSNLYGSLTRSERTLNRAIRSTFDYVMNIFRFFSVLRGRFQYSDANISVNSPLMMIMYNKNVCIRLFYISTQCGHSWSVAFRMFHIPEQNRHPSGNRRAKGTAPGTVERVYRVDLVFCGHAKHATPRVLRLVCFPLANCCCWGACEL